MGPGDLSRALSGVPAVSDPRLTAADAKAAKEGKSQPKSLPTKEEKQKALKEQEKKSSGQ